MHMHDFRTDCTDSPGLFTDIYEHIRFYFLVLFPTFYFFGSVHWIKLTYGSF